MELPHIGQQCEVKACQQLDFLPIKCDKCGGRYCKNHSLPQYHGCEAYHEHTKEDNDGAPEGKVCGGESIKRHPCQVEGCAGGELTPVLCPGCNRNYCLAHRHQPDHQCPTLLPPDNTVKEAAATRIKEITDSLSSGNAGKTGQGRRSKQLSAKVQLMKLKQKSTGDNGIPQQDRIYLLVLLPKSSAASTTSVPVFVSRHWSLGRSIDAIAMLAKLKNNNNISTAKKLRLFHPHTGAALGKPDQNIHQKLSDVNMQNGETVILEYVDDGVECLLDCLTYG